MAKSKSDEIENRLRTGALSLLERDGAQALSARKIATEAGRTTMCIYSHFGSVPALLGSLYDNLADDLLSAVDQGDEPTLTLAAWAETNPGSYRLLFLQDLATLGLDPAQRARLVEELVRRTGGIDRLAMAHGMLSLSLTVAGELEPPEGAPSWTEFVRARLVRLCSA